MGKILDLIFGIERCSSDDNDDAEQKALEKAWRNNPDAKGWGYGEDTGDCGAGHGKGRPSKTYSSRSDDSDKGAWDSYDESFPDSHYR